MASVIDDMHAELTRLQNEAAKAKTDLTKAEQQLADARRLATYTDRMAQFCQEQLAEYEKSSPDAPVLARNGKGEMV